MSTVTTAQPATTGCGCGSGGGCGGGCQGACGGAASQASAFIRPNFFAGQLLTEDDLQALTGYVTGKRRLTNRLVFGPGVVCGLEVVCDPCGGGKVTVRPGYALDCCGNDIVLDCPESVDVNALIRDLRIRSLGVDCGEDCGEGTDANGRQYQLYVRYTEQPTDPIAPYPTGEPCSSSDCSPSRIRETFTFVIKCGTPASHRYDPGDFLTARFGAMDALSAVYNGDRHLAPYVAPLRNTVAAAGTTVTFDDAAVQQLTTATGAVNDLLNQVGQQSLTPPQAQDLTERVRVLASSVARYLVSDQSSKVSLTEAQQALDQATTKLNGTDTITVWDDQLRAELATALISEVRARLLPSGAAAAAPLETRMLAQGAPLSYDLRRSINAGLNTQWQWLLVRLDTSGGVSDCATSGTVAGITLPPALPPPQDGQGPHPTTAELSTTADALEKLHAALLGYLADSACASLHPPCGDCAQTDLLLAEVTVRDCTVVEICTSGREQVLPGGSGYAGWLPTLYQARPLAEQVCCQPMVAPPGQPDPQLPYLPGLFRQPPLTPLDQLLALLLPAVGGAADQSGSGPVAGFTGPGLVAGGSPAVPAATDPTTMVAAWNGPGGSDPGPAGADAVKQELADLRGQVSSLTEMIAGLRSAAASAPASGTAQPSAAQPQPATVEPAAAQPSTVEAAEGAPAPEPAPAKPSTVEPAKAAPAKAEPAKAAPAKSTPAKANPPRGGGGRAQRRGTRG